MRYSAPFGLLVTLLTFCADDSIAQGFAPESETDQVEARQDKVNQTDVQVEARQAKVNQIKARQAGSSQVKSNQETIVTFNVKAVVSATGDGIPALPSNIMGYLSEQEPLAKLDVEYSSEKGVARLEALFAFKSMQEYESWRERPETSEFVSALRSSRQGDVRFAVGMVKHPMGTYLQQHQNR